MGKDRKNTAIYTAYDDIPATDPSVPEKNLLRAILMSALSDIKKTGEAGEKARQYLLSQEEDYIFSFRSVCSYLSVDPNRILTVTGLGEDDASPDSEQTDNDEPRSAA